MKTTGLPLVDYHLLLNGEDYRRTAGNGRQLPLPFPFNWIVSRHRRAKAEQRIASIGLGDHLPTISNTTVNTDDPDDPTAGGHLESSTSPSLLFARFQSKQKSMKEQISATQFRIEAAVDRMCEPLDNVLAARMAPPEPESFSFMIEPLIWGYFSILLHKDLPDKTVTNTIRERWPAIADFFDQHDIARSNRNPDRYPPISIEEQPDPSIRSRLSAFVAGILDVIIPTHTQIRLSYLLRGLPSTAPLLILGVVTATTGIATLAYAAHTLLAPKIRPDAPNQATYVFSRLRPGLSGMGASGATLAALFGPASGVFDNSARMHQERSDAGGVRMTQEVRQTAPEGVEVAEVDVEVERE